MAVNLFITEQFIKDHSILDENVDMYSLLPIIKECQEIYIKPILGTALYDQISSQVGSSSLSADNTTLVNDYIQWALMYHILTEAVDVITFQLTNKGLIKRTGQNIETLAVEDVKRFIDKYKNKAEWYTERLRLYLEANTTTYTLYLSPGTSVDTIHPAKTSYSTGIYLGDSGVKKSIIDRYENGDCDGC